MQNRLVSCLIIHILLFFASTHSFAQSPTPSLVFWDNLKKHCGKSYEGEIISGADNDTFKGKTLKMQVLSCENNVIKIPFYVGEDKSRTWFFTLIDNKILLKHDHRHEDGSSDKITMYGGKSTNVGQLDLQVFPADDETALMLPQAAANVWWVGLKDDSFTYNLRRIGSERYFSVKFNLAKPIILDWRPWGWKAD
jgi:hypothetical protein